MSYSLYLRGLIEYEEARSRMRNPVLLERSGERRAR